MQKVYDIIYGEMKMKKKNRWMKIIAALAFILLILFGIIWFIFLRPSVGLSAYGKAKSEMESYLNRNLEELTETANAVLQNQRGEQTTLKGEPYAAYHTNENNQEYVQYDIDAQGMLGGQYWGLYYIPDNEYLGADDIYWQEDGNNIFILEKMCDNWFFYYMDYDGKTKMEDVYGAENG